MRQIRGILFDKDGTLFDFNATWAVWAQDFLSTLAQGDGLQAQNLGRQIGFETETGCFDPASPAIAGTPDEIAALLLPHLNNWTAADLLAHMNAAAARAPQCEAVPLAALTTELLARGYQLGVATNDAEAPALAHLRTAGVAQAFSFVAGCDSGFGAKPAPGQLLAFAAQAGLAPEQVAMVGDSRHDLLAGRAAGMATVAVLTGPAQAADLQDLADVVLPDIGHLPAWLSA